MTVKVTSTQGWYKAAPSYYTSN